MSVDLVGANVLPALGAFLLMTSCGMLSTWLFYLIRADVNAKLPASRSISPVGFHAGVYIRVMRIHSELCPHSNLRIILKATIWVGLASTVALGWFVGIIGP